MKKLQKNTKSTNSYKIRCILRKTVSLILLAVLLLTNFTLGSFKLGFLETTEVKAASIAPVDPNALQITKDLMDYLVNLKYRTDNKVLLGQTVAIKMDSFLTDVVELEESTGKYPAFIQPWTGNWWSNESYANINLENAIPQLINSFNRGAIPMLLLNPNNPWNGLGYGQDKVSQIFVPDGHTLEEIYDPSTDAYKAYHEQLDIVAEGLSMLQDQGIPVVLRIFGECNYGTHWYHLNQPDMSNDQFKALWTHTVDYFTETKGLHNILFCYEIAEGKPNRMGGLVVDKTDIVAFQTHKDNITYNSYTEYKELTDKPIVIGQYLIKNQPDYDNMDMINTIRNYNPDIVGVLYWSNNCNITSKLNEDQLVADSWIITADETPYSKNPLPVDLPYTSPLLPYINQLSHSYNFNVQGDLEGWTPWDNQTEKIGVGNFYSLMFNSVGIPAYEAYMDSPTNMNVDASTIDNFRIRMQNFSQASKLKLQWITDSDNSWDENKSILIDISKGDMEFKEYTYDFSTHPNWSGRINQVRVYPLYDSWAGACYIDYISFLDDATFNMTPQPEPTPEPDPLNIAYGKTSSTNDYTTHYFTPDLAVDADPHTRFSKGVNGVNTIPLWWKIDLDDIYDITDIDLLFEQNVYEAGDPDQPGNQYTISVSMDDVNYTTVVDNSAQLGIQGLQNHSVNTTGRYVKVEFTNGATIYECDIRGNLSESIPGAVLYDNFNNETTGSEPTGWTADTTGGTVSVVEVPSSLDKSIKMEKLDDVNSSSISKTFTPQSGSGIIIEVDAKAGQTNELINVINILNGSTNVIKVSFAGNGEIKYKENGSLVSVQPYSPDTWYNIKVELDTYSNLYNLYIDDIQVAMGLNLIKPTTEVDTFKCGFADNNKGIVYVDNVKVIEAPPLADDHFNNEITGNEPTGWFTNTAGGTISVAEVPSLSDKSVKIEDTSTTQSTGMSKTFTSKSGSLVVEMDMMSPERNHLLNAFNVKSGTTDVVKVMFDGKKIYYDNGGVLTSAGLYNANQWYNIKVDLDTVTDTYDFYIDGTVIASGVNFTNTIIEVDTFECTIDSLNNGTVFVDNLYIK